jgi:hypothetical protein
VTENSLRTLEAAGFGDIPVVQGAAVALDGTYYDPRKGERVPAPPGFSVSSIRPHPPRLRLFLPVTVCQQ